MAHPETGVQVTTGTPIGLLIENTDQRSKDYSDIKDTFRPGHARISPMKPNMACAIIAAAGARPRARPRCVSRPGRHRPEDRARDDPCAVRWCRWAAQNRSRKMGLGRNRAQSVFLPGQVQGRVLRKLSRRHQKEGLVDRRGGSRWSPKACRRDWVRRSTASSTADLAAAMMSINAVKGVEIGAGFGAAELSGEQNADEMRMGNQGVSSCPIMPAGFWAASRPGSRWGAFAVKPTSSILSPRRTVDRNGADTDIVTKGRHDPCVGIRAVPVGEAMMACVLADHFLRHRGQVGGGNSGNAV